MVIEATPVNGLATDSLALCDQIFRLLVSLLAEPFGRLEPGLLAQLSLAQAPHAEGCQGCLHKLT